MLGFEDMFLSQPKKILGIHIVHNTRASFFIEKNLFFHFFLSKGVPCPIILKRGMLAVSLMKIDVEARCFNFLY